MSKRMQNFLLIAAVIALTVFPLVSIDAAPGPDGELVEIFTGADGQAEDVIQQIAPDYTPWFSSIIVPPSVEIESLLFALQAALGAGIIGYYLGYCRGRVKTADESADSNYVA
jgi:cobalt/nickel transport protein